MKIKLYHYVHCPFCIRVRMALGYLNIPFESVVVPYDDEKTPIELTGKKMLPIAVIDGVAHNESLDIIALADLTHKLKLPKMLQGPTFMELNTLLNQWGENVHSLAMPYWIWTPEFTPTSRQYFQHKKETKRGPFKELVKNRAGFEEKLNRDLEHLSKSLTPFYQSNEFSIYDILIASHLWGLYVVPEYRFPEKLHDYLQNVKASCHFEYHKDFWC
jgi:glutaredoxin 2